MGVVINPDPVYTSGSQYSFTNSAGVPYRRPGYGYEFSGSAGSIYQSYMQISFTEPNSANILVPYDTSKAAPHFSATAAISPSSNLYPVDPSTITSYCVYDGDVYDCTAGDWYNTRPNSTGYYDYRDRTAALRSVNIIYAPFVDWPSYQFFPSYKDITGYLRIEHPPYNKVNVAKSVRKTSPVNQDQVSESSYYFWHYENTTSVVEDDGKRYSYWTGEGKATTTHTQPIETIGFWRYASYLRVAGVSVNLSLNTGSAAALSSVLYNPTGFAYDYAISANSSQETSTVHMFNKTQHVFSNVSGIVFSGTFFSGASSDIAGLGDGWHGVILGIDTAQTTTLKLEWTYGNETASASSEFITASAGKSSCNFSASVFNTAGISEFTPWVSAYPLRYGLWNTRYVYSATAR